MIDPAPLSRIVRSDPDIMGGVPCFAGTRVPAAYLFEHLKQGGSVDDFIDEYPSVAREQATALLDVAERRGLPDAA
jgi:uncharacterized protein (DUF433 family)